MGNIKQKENINANPSEDIPIAHTPTRAEQLAKREYDKKFAYADDIMPMLKKVGGTLIESEQRLPQVDRQTYDKNEWERLNEKSFNKKNNAYYTWH